MTVLFCLHLAGCNGSIETDVSTTAPAESSSVPRQPLRVLVIDDPELGSVIQREWRARSSVEVEIRDRSPAELDDGLREAPDVIVYPAGLLGELAERHVIQPIPERLLEQPAVDRRDILTFDRGTIVTWGQNIYAFSFGSPQFVLFYRADIFDRMDISPPSTWEQYQEVAERLNDKDWASQLGLEIDEGWSGTTEPLAPGWAGQILLVRAAAYARRRNRFSTLFDFASMDPLIDRPPFRRALGELVAAAGVGRANAEQLDPWLARRELLDGRCAMALSLPGGRFDDVADRSGFASAEFSIAPAPGSLEAWSFIQEHWEARDPDATSTVPVLGVAGRLGSVVRTTRQMSAALNLLANLNGPELSAQIAPRSKHTTMFRTSHLRKPTDWIDPSFSGEAAEQYADLVRQTDDATVWLHAIRIPGRSRYLAALDQAVHDALSGVSPADALKSAADKWRDITQVLEQQNGAGTQHTAYSRSLGLEP